MFHNEICLVSGAQTPRFEALTDLKDPQSVYFLGAVTASKKSHQNCQSFQIGRDAEAEQNDWRLAMASLLTTAFAWRVAVAQ